MRVTSHFLVLVWQAALLTVVTTGAVIAGMGPRIWLFGGALILGATAHAKWLQRRGLPPLTLPDIRKTTSVSAATCAALAGTLSAFTSTADPVERVVVAIGAALISGFATGVLTLCGLSLGTGSEQPVTTVLPDPAHPGRPRRPIRPPRGGT